MDLQTEIRDYLAGFPVGSGYYETSVSVDEAREMAQIVMELLEATVFQELYELNNEKITGLLGDYT